MSKTRMNLLIVVVCMFVTVVVSLTLFSVAVAKESVEADDMISDPSAFSDLPFINPNLILDNFGLDLIKYKEIFSNEIDQSSDSETASHPVGEVFKYPLFGEAVNTDVVSIDIDCVVVAENKIRLGKGIHDSNIYTKQKIKKLEIPSYIDGLEIDELANYLFFNADIKEVSVPSTVTKIGDNCFKNSALTKIEFENLENVNQGVSVIGESAFDGCNLTDTLSLPASLLEIKKQAFVNNENLKIIELYSKDVIIQKSTFNCLPNLKMFKSYDDTKIHLDFTVEKCTNCGQELTINSLLNKDHWKHIFDNTPVPTYGSLLRQAEKPQMNCTLTYVDTKSESSKNLDLTLTLDNSSMTCVVGMPETDRLCYSNTDVNIKSLEIPSVINGYTVVEIGESAFRNSNIEKITIPPSVKTIGKRAFAFSKLGYIEFQGLYNNSENVEYICKEAFYGSKFAGCFSLPRNIKRIDSWAFCYCKNITAINFNSDIIQLGWNVFADNKDLKIVRGYENTKVFTSGLSKTTLEDYCSCKYNGCNLWNVYNYNCNTPDYQNIECNKIRFHSEDNDSIFYECIIPNTLTYAQKYGSQFPAIQELEDYDAYWYDKKTNLVINTDIKLSADLDLYVARTLKKDHQMFVNSDGVVYVVQCLEEVDFLNRKVNIVSATTDKEDVSIMEEYTDRGCKYEILGLLDSAMKNNTMLKHVNLNVSDIGKRAFYNCTNLETVDFSNVGCIYAEAFAQCVSLKNIEFTSFISYIGTEAFKNCTALTSVQFTNYGSQSIIMEGNFDMFKGCNALDVIRSYDDLNFLEGKSSCPVASAIHYFSQSSGKTIRHDIINLNTKNYKANFIWEYDKGTAKSFDINFDWSFDILSQWRNDKYNKNLAKISAGLANSAYVEAGPMATCNGATMIYEGCQHSKVNIFDPWEGLGFDDIQKIDVGKGKDKTTIFIGNKVTGRENYYVCSVRGTNGTYDEWESNFEIGADTNDYYDRNNQYWKHKENHKGFDVAANCAIEAIDNYVSEHKLNGPNYILINGHSRGASIANLIGKEYEDRENWKPFTYTFAAPSPTTASNYADYKTIFNIQNGDDLVTMLPLETWGFHAYGRSIKVNLSDNDELEKKVEKLAGWTDYMPPNLISLTEVKLATNATAANREAIYKKPSHKDYSRFSGVSYRVYIKDRATVTILNSLGFGNYYDYQYVDSFIGEWCEVRPSPAFCYLFLSKLAVNAKNLSLLTLPHLDMDSTYALLVGAFCKAGVFMADPHVMVSYYCIVDNCT